MFPPEPRRTPALHVHATNRRYSSPARRSSSSDLGAAAFQQDHVSPGAVVAADPFADADCPEAPRGAAPNSPRSPGRCPTGWSRCRPARSTRSARPAARGPRPARPPPDRRRRSARPRRRRPPGSDTLLHAIQPSTRSPFHSDEAMSRQVLGHEVRPVRRLGLEGGVAGGDADPIDVQDPAGVLVAHRPDVDLSGMHLAGWGRQSWIQTEIRGPADRVPLAVARCPGQPPRAEPGASLGTPRPPALLTRSVRSASTSSAPAGLGDRGPLRLDQPAADRLGEPASHERRNAAGCSGSGTAASRPARAPPAPAAT